MNPVPAFSPPPLTVSTPLPVAIPPVVVWTRRLAVASLVALFVLGPVWELWLAPLRPGGTLLALKMLPLGLAIAGLLRNRMYTYRWLSLMVWVYFTEGVVRATSDTHPVSRALAGVEVLLCILLFIACALHVRWRLKHSPRVAEGAQA